MNELKKEPQSGDQFFQDSIAVLSRKPGSIVYSLNVCYLIGMLCLASGCLLDKERYPALPFFEITETRVTLSGDKISLEATVSELGEESNLLTYGFLFFEKGGTIPFDSIVSSQTFTPQEDDFRIEILVREQSGLKVFCDYRVLAFVYEPEGRRIEGDTVELVQSSAISLLVLQSPESIENDEILLEAVVSGLEVLNISPDTFGYYYADVFFDESTLSSATEILITGSLPPTGTFPIERLTDLNFNNTYFVRAYLRLDGKDYLSELQEFQVVDGWELLDPAFISPGIVNGIGVEIGDQAYFGLGSRSPSFANPSTKLWSMDLSGNIREVTPFPGTPRTDAIAFAIADTLYYGLGFLNVPGSPDYFDDMWAFYPQENGGMGRWEPLLQDPFPGGERAEAVVFVLDEMAYAGSGTTPTFPFPTADFYSFNPSKSAGEKWSPIESIGLGRTKAVAFTDAGKGYVGLGFNGFSDDFSDFWEFTSDGGTGSWEALDAIPFPGAPRGGSLVFQLEGKAYIGTGSKSNAPTPDQFYTDFWEVDLDKLPASPWSRRTTFIGSGRTGAIGFTLDGKGYVLG